LLLNECLLL